MTAYFHIGSHHLRWVGRVEEVTTFSLEDPRLGWEGRGEGSSRGGI